MFVVRFLTRLQVKGPMRLNMNSFLAGPDPRQ
jgi:hypothetical protein